MISIIQAIIVIFALFAWSRVFLRARSKDVGIWEFIFWSGIWVAVIIIAIFPTTFNSISNWFGAYNLLNMAVYVSVVLLLYLVYRLYVKLGRQQREITTLVREVAISKVAKKKRK